ncbi:MAG: hypothetical protein RDU30_02810 [Desulfovibrionaceae bacterium]|nr:hypothetical protein [Desulfovibrionaceae bacterium]
MSWQADVERFLAGGMRREELLVIEQTPLVLRSLGAPEFPMAMTQRVAHKVLNDHAISVKILKELPQHLEQPVAVFDSASRPDSGSLVVLTEAHQVETEWPIIAAIQLDTVQRGSRNMQVNGIASVYGREKWREWLLTQFEQNTRYYDKEKLLTLGRRTGLQLPGPSNMRSNISILTNQPLVNSPKRNPSKEQRPEPEASPLAEPLRQSARNYLEAEQAYKASFRAPRKEVARCMATTQKAKEAAREHFVTEATRFINSHGVEAFRTQMNEVAGPKATELSNEVLQSRGKALETGLELSLTSHTRLKGTKGEE